VLVGHGRLLDAAVVRPGGVVVTPRSAVWRHFCERATLLVQYIYGRIAILWSLSYFGVMEMTPAQCRAARGLLAISQDRLVELSGVSKRTISQFEGEQRQPIPATRFALQHALEAAGVTFIAENGGGPGVRLRRGSVSDPPST
jgi:DNA-binding XRE family transcriptional regulator